MEYVEKKTPKNKQNKTQTMEAETVRNEYDSA